MKNREVSTVSSAVQSELGLLLNIECVRDLGLVGQVAQVDVCLSVFTRVCSMTATPCDCRVVCQKSTFQPPHPPSQTPIAGSLFPRLYYSLLIVHAPDRLRRALTLMDLTTPPPHHHTRPNVASRLVCSRGERSDQENSS